MASRKKRNSLDEGGQMRRKKIRVEVEVTPGDMSIDEFGIVWVPWTHVEDAPKEILRPQKAAAAGTATA